MSDQVTLVNEHDQVIGSMDKIEAHRGSGQLHRAISVFLFRKNTAGETELLIQQRSLQKIVGAGQWANTACGNVWPGESYEECAVRRLKHELGIELTANQLTPITTFRYQVQCNQEFSENEIDQVFAGWYEGVVEPKAAEVMSYQWLRWPDLSTSHQQPTTNFAPWFELLLTDEKVLTGLQKFITAH